ncbi:hypothetical protein SAY86_004012 [Trapa natans]|uniref:Thylakoid lumenal 17.9 kDa protein, chloroplastic n=1 Tax=Trapa natans TaxID=22666 RepID=A0AAN7MDQ4_TRANT|nr:hypothetical protein SAY86_004012 [Trapa natans]
MMALCPLVLSITPFPSSSSFSSKCNCLLKVKSAALPPQTPSSISKLRPLPGFLSLALTLTLSTSTPSPSLAIPPLNTQPSPPSLTTPFSQSKNQPLGLEDGKIRACPSTNPGCISTNPKSSSFAFPWKISDASAGNAVQRLKEAILKTQKNPKIQADEDTPYGQYLQAEVDGGFGRDVLEFLVRDDVVTYRDMAAKVTYVYPFTTAIGDSKGQEERLKKLIDELGWYAPTFDSMD